MLFWQIKKNLNFYYYYYYKFVIDFRFILLFNFLSTLFMNKFFSKLHTQKYFKPIFITNFFKKFSFFTLQKFENSKFEVLKNFRKRMFRFKRFTQIKKYFYKALKYFRNNRYALHEFRKYSLRNFYNKKIKKPTKFKKKLIILRRNCNLLKNLFNFQKKKKNSFTNFIKRFNSYSTISLHKFFTQNILFFLYQIKFGYTFHQIKYFLKHGFIYKNGIQINQPWTILKFGDRINLKISLIFYKYYKYYIIRFSKLITHLHKIAVKFYLYNYKVQKQYPHINTKFLKMYPPLTISPKYCEIDYKSFTCVFLLKSSIGFFPNQFFTNWVNIHFFKVYNWKLLI